MDNYTYKYFKKNFPEWALQSGILIKGGRKSAYKLGTPCWLNVLDISADSGDRDTDLLMPPSPIKPKKPAIGKMPTPKNILPRNYQSLTQNKDIRKAIANHLYSNFGVGNKQKQSSGRYISVRNGSYASSVFQLLFEASIERKNSDTKNEIIQSIGEQCVVPIIIPFVSTRSCGTHSCSNSIQSQSSSIYCLDKKPYIFDNRYEETISSTNLKQGILYYKIKHPTTFVANIPIILDQYRWASFHITNINNSNYALISDLCKNIINTSIGSYKNFVCNGVYTPLKSVLCDQVFINVYKLEDVIPIFTRDPIDGFCIEIEYSNSVYSKVVSEYNDSSVMNHFLLQVVVSKTNENISTIDGDQINWWGGANVYDYIEDFFNKVNNVKNIKDKGVIIKCAE